jgi:hypothetical protein
MQSALLLLSAYTAIKATSDPSLLFFLPLCGTESDWGFAFILVGDGSKNKLPCLFKVHNLYFFPAEKFCILLITQMPLNVGGMILFFSIYVCLFRAQCETVSGNHFPFFWIVFFLLYWGMKHQKNNSRKVSECLHLLYAVSLQISGTFLQNSTVCSSSW